MTKALLVRKIAVEANQLVKEIEEHGAPAGVVALRLTSIINICGVAMLSAIRNDLLPGPEAFFDGKDSDQEVHTDAKR